MCAVAPHRLAGNCSWLSPAVSRKIPSSLLMPARPCGNVGCVCQHVHHVCDAGMVVQNMVSCEHGIAERNITITKQSIWWGAKRKRIDKEVMEASHTGEHKGIQLLRCIDHILCESLRGTCTRRSVRIAQHHMHTSTRYIHILCKI